MADMDNYLTQHAGDALEKRRIPTEWMERVLTVPDCTERDPMDADLEHRLGRIREFENRVLRRYRQSHGHAAVCTISV